MKFAAIDIGSNAVRLLFTQVLEYEKRSIFKKEALFRMPLRLGEDVFAHGEISEAKTEDLLHTMLAYSYLIKSYHPVDFKACATSAMREARNGNAIVKQIADQAGLRIEIIDGKREAEIIYANHIADMLHPKKNYLYIDVGGGSTELTLMVKSQGVASHSFNLGTVRMLQGRVEQSEWQKMQDWLENLSKAYANIEGIGSGGSINKIFKMSRKKAEQPLSYKELKAISKLLASYTYHERIQILGLRPDRADVIIPASKIYLSAMQYAKIKKMHVPQVGLADGIVHLLYEEQKRQHSSVQPYHSSSS